MTHGGRQPIPRRAWCQIAGVTAVGLLLLNWRHPVLRASSPIVNSAVMLAVALAVLLLPWLLAVRAWRLQPLVFRIPATAAAAIVGLAFAPFALLAALDLGDVASLRDGDSGFMPVSTVELRGSRVRAYETNGGATTDLGFVVRHERQVVPGVLLVRELYNEYHARGGLVEPVGTDRVRILAHYDAPIERRVMSVRPWVWF